MQPLTTTAPLPGALTGGLTDAAQAMPPRAEPALPRQSLAASTLVQTEAGLCPVGAVTIGQRIRTRLGTLEPVRAVTRRHFTLAQLHDQPKAAPVRFDAGALPGMEGAEAVLVSADCRIAWAEGPAPMATYPARAFCDGGAIRRVLPEAGIDFIRLHLDDAHQVSVGGIWVVLDDEAAPVAPPALTQAAEVSGAPQPALVRDTRVFRPLSG